jgi:hypothetical protein
MFCIDERECSYAGILNLLIRIAKHLERRVSSLLNSFFNRRMEVSMISFVRNL